VLKEICKFFVRKREEENTNRAPHEVQSDSEVMKVLAMTIPKYTGLEILILTIHVA
jgi:hypothetical protein